MEVGSSMAVSHNVRMEEFVCPWMLLLGEDKSLFVLLLEALVGRCVMQRLE